jgi:hypothetical protein
MTDLANLYEELHRLSAELRERGLACAEHDSHYKRQWAKEFLKADAKTVSEREATANFNCSVQHREALIARALEKSATEAVRCRRQQISALQTLASAYKAEAEFVRTAPAGIKMGGA